METSYLSHKKKLKGRGEKGKYRIGGKRKTESKGGGFFLPKRGSLSIYTDHKAENRGEMKTCSG